MPRPKALPRILAETPAAVATLDGVQTDRQADFVRYYAQTGVNGAEAARLAGYSEPKQAAWRLLSLPHVRAAVRAAREVAINGDLAKLALETLGQLMTAETTPAAVKHSAARTSLEMAGHLGKAPETALADRPLAELSVAELQRFVEEGERALASVKIVPAKVISAPHNAPNTSPTL
jgi:phage terminase small subunit